MYQKHSSFESPEDENAKIWRFMDFAKYVDILTNNSLFFCRADLLGDPFEGKYTTHMIKTFSEHAKNEKDVKLFKNFFIKEPNLFVKIMFLNCWYMDDVEPYSMWKSFTKSNQAIAIQSTFKKFVKSFEKNKKFSVFIGKVKYIDFRKSSIPYDNAFNPLLYKRLNFKHESELRAIVTNTGLLGDETKNAPNGYRVEADLSKLIEEIRLAPTSPKWFTDLVKSISTKFSLNNSVTKSELDEKPFE